MKKKHVSKRERAMEVHKTYAKKTYDSGRAVEGSVALKLE